VTFLDRLIAALEAFRDPVPATTVTGGESDVPSVDLVFDEMRKTLTDQETLRDTLDTKATFFLTSGSIIIGFAGLQRGTTDELDIGRFWLIPLLLIYLALVLLVIAAYRPRGFEPIGLEPETLPDYLEEDPDYTKRQFIATMREIHQKNVRPLNRKGLYVILAQAALVIEVTYLVFVLIIHIW